MKLKCLICYSFIIAIVIIGLIIISKKLKIINSNIENFNNSINDKVNVYNSLIDNKGDFPPKVINAGENNQFEYKEDEFIIKPQYYNSANHIIDSAYEVLPEKENESPFKFITDFLSSNETNKEATNKEIKSEEKEMEKGYFLDLGDIDGSLREVKSNYLCGKKQWPVGFDLKTNKEISENVKNNKYSRNSPYNSGMSAMSYGKDGESNYGFACVDNSLSDWYYCRGGNACDFNKIKDKKTEKKTEKKTKTEKNLD